MNMIILTSICRCRSDMLVRMCAYVSLCVLISVGLCEIECMRL